MVLSISVDVTESSVLCLRLVDVWRSTPSVGQNTELNTLVTALSSLLQAWDVQLETRTGGEGYFYFWGCVVLQKQDKNKHYKHQHTDSEQQGSYDKLHHEKHTHSHISTYLYTYSQTTSLYNQYTPSFSKMYKRVTTTFYSLLNILKLASNT